MPIFRGGCHCGNVTVEIETALGADDLPRRACQCTFCRRHGAITTSDPAGAVRIVLHDPARVSHYQFGLRTAEFLVCAVCGVYAAVVLHADGATWAVVNVNTLEGTFGGAIQPMNYDGETAEQRVERRQARWTPATLRIGSSGVAG